VRPSPQSNLYASDDGGFTWHSIGQRIEQQQLTIVGMATSGTTIFALANALPKNECDTTPPTSSLWKSTDGGATWNKMTAPACMIISVSFTSQADGNGFFGVALVEHLDAAHPTAFSLLFSSDSGAIWTALPDFAPQNGTAAAADTGSAPNIAVTPSGAVIAEFTTLLKNPTTSDAEIYLLSPHGASPDWRHYASGHTEQWQVVHGEQLNGLWGLDNVLSGSPLAYLPLL
jgi:hypothetical protein